MDQIKIGKFIAEMRKEQNLTQIDLAEQLGISNKTISKWECGNGMPDYAVMEGLCDILKINVNELLSGERLPSQDYSKKAEENMMSLMQESSQNYKREKREMILTVMGIAVLLVIVLIGITMLWGENGVAEIANYVDVPTYAFIFVITTAVLLIAGAGKAFVSAFSLAVKKNVQGKYYQINKSLFAMKLVMVTVNTAGLLSAVIGIFTSLKEWGRGEYDLEFLAIWIAVGLLGIVYSLVTTLVLLPIYAKLKCKLIEE